MQSVLAWGSNANGQLGSDNGHTRSGVPVVVSAGEFPAGTSITQVAVGAFHSLALSSTERIYAWGGNSSGQLGNDTAANSPIPVPVSAGAIPAGTKIIQIAAGGLHSLALSSTGQVYAWGDNSSGQLGNDTASNSPVPIPVSAGAIPAGTKIVQIAAGYAHSLALSSTGQIYAWGLNVNLQLGSNATGYESPVPVAVSAGAIPPGTRITQIAAGGAHSLALSSTGRIYAWGNNDYGQLGNDDRPNASPVPVAVSAGAIPRGTRIARIVAGHTHSLALSSAGKVYAWGANDGNLGNHRATISAVPVAVSAGAIPAGTRITQIAAGYLHSLALSSTGQVYAWGHNLNGQLGNGHVPTTSYVPVAVKLPPGARIESIALGSSASHALAINGGQQRPLVLANAAESSRIWREANSRARRPPTGTTFSFVLSEQATVALRFTQQAPGRRLKRRCVARYPRQKRTESACKLTVTLGTSSFSAHAGQNKIKFQGRITNLKRLKPGRYMLIISATNAAHQRSKPETLTFTIVK